MNRRNFLGAMLAAASAPAIVKADNLMKIVVPKQEIKLLNQNGISGAHMNDLDISSMYARIEPAYDIYNMQEFGRLSVVNPNGEIAKVHMERQRQLTTLDRPGRTVEGVAAEYDFFLRRQAGWKDMNTQQAAAVRLQFMRQHHPEYAKRFYV